MLMWTNVLEGQHAPGEFDFVYFTGPSDFAPHFGLDGKADLEKLEAYYDATAKTDSETPAAPGQFETQIAPGNAGACRN